MGVRAIIKEWWTELGVEIFQNIPGILEDFLKQNKTSSLSLLEAINN